MEQFVESHVEAPLLDPDELLPEELPLDEPPDDPLEPPSLYTTPELELADPLLPDPPLLLLELEEPPALASGVSASAGGSAASAPC